IASCCCSVLPASLDPRRGCTVLSSKHTFLTTMDSPPPTAQSWAPPKHPLPPHRLARLANALGVSTPMPAIHTPSPILSPSYNGSSPALDQYRRSPTPSTASTFGFSASTSKFLLHVIPPIHLPHDSDSFDSDLTPPPSNASGYHTQFRRGTLVPVHSTLQSQLGAIAKEYALPSTSGLVLYLVSQRSPSSRSPPPSEKSFGEEMDEPGPRLSEDIWRHLWTRVLRAEIREEPVSHLAPPLLGLGFTNRSTPYLNHAYPLPLLSTNSQNALLTPSPTTPSSTSDIPSRFATKSAPPSSSSRSPSDDAHDTPDTSQAASDRADSLDLPGLQSDALIPILAKVEFDIDRRKAGWYEPWLRSRRMNHAKRTRGRKNTGESSGGSADEGQQQPLAAFRLNAKSSLSRRYLPLSESPNSMGSDSEADADADGEGTDAGKHHDPLADVFGDDADAWADMRLRGAPKRPANPHVVQLALSAAELGNGFEYEEGESPSPSSSDDLRDVTALIGGMGARRRAPAPLVLASSAGSSASSPPKIVPPPPPSDEELEGRVRLPYLEGAEEEFDEKKKAPRKSMYDPAKRKGVSYEDMDLGFAVDDLDVDDPNDRRKSQVIMHAQLNEIEKNLAQFSPRRLKSELAQFSPRQQHKSELEEEEPGFSFGQASPHLSPSGRGGFAQQAQRALLNADVFPPTPRLPHHPDIHPEREGDSDDDDLSQQAAWPAVPFTSLPDRDPSRTAAGERSPPRLAINGVNTSMPKRFRASTSSRASSASAASSESEVRKRELLLEQQSQPYSPKVPVYPAMTPSIGPKSSLNSPLIPLSPDPFGRHPSEYGGSGGIPSGLGGVGGQGGKGKGARESASYWDPPAVIPASVPPPEPQRKSSAGSSSRFSTDSMNGGGGGGESSLANKRSTLMSVKTIKKLWRKSNKNSVSNINTVLRPPTVETVQENAYSPLSPPPPMRPNRPSMEDMELPDVGDVPAPRTPVTGSFPGSGSASSSRRPSTDVPPVPQLGAAGRRPSVSSASQERRPSLSVLPAQERAHSQMSMQSLHSNHSQVSVQPSLSQSQSQPHLGLGPGQGQLSVPPPMLRSANSAPIVPRAGPPRKPSMDGLHWDQESPYPTRAMPPSRAPSASSSRPPSAQSNYQVSPPNTSSPLNSSSAYSPPNTSSPPTTSPPPPPPVPEEHQRHSVRKSILKWKSATNNNANAVPAPLTPSASTFRTHKKTASGISGPGSISGSPSQGSPLLSANAPLDIPPSPKIPEQFITSYVGSHPPPPQQPHSRPNSAAIARRRLSAKMVSTSTDGGSSTSGRRHRAQGSMASSHSHGSGETHESTSLDTSGFEIVSPKMGGALSFPYHELDHHDQRPVVGGLRM
ncbi:hypothetical protein C8R46DRAFT_1253314, partial [Mycena filopes]